MTSFTSIALILLLIQYSFEQGQNLCRDAEANKRVFAPDPSNCNRYIWCENLDPSITHILDCRDNNPNFPFFRDDFCVTTNEHCNPPLLMCPPADQPDIMIADPMDPSCTRFRPCRLPGITPFECQQGTRFDPSTGVCISEDRVICPIDNESPFSCVGKENGMWPYPGSCTIFVFCFNGEEILRNECQEGYWFDPTPGIQICVPGVCSTPSPDEMFEISTKVA